MYTILGRRRRRTACKLSPLSPLFCIAAVYANGDDDDGRRNPFKGHQQRSTVGPIVCQIRHDTHCLRPNMTLANELSRSICRGTTCTHVYYARLRRWYTQITRVIDCFRLFTAVGRSSAFGFPWHQ